MKRTTKTIIASMLLVSSILMASCSKDTEESSSTVLGESRDTTTSETTIAQADMKTSYADIMGTYSEPAYVNLNSELTITTPEGWTHLDEEATSEFWGNDALIRKPEDELSFNDVAYESVWKAENGDNMCVMLMYVPGCSADDYSAVLNTTEFETVRLGSQDISVTYSSYDVDGTEIINARIINYNNDTMTVITINCLTQEGLDEVLSKINFS